MASMPSRESSAPSVGCKPTVDRPADHKGERVGSDETPEGKRLSRHASIERRCVAGRCANLPHADPLTIPSA